MWATRTKGIFHFQNNTSTTCCLYRKQYQKTYNVALSFKAASDDTADATQPSTPPPPLTIHKVEHPHAIFPWRHSSSPLPRLIPSNPEFQANGGYLGPQLCLSTTKYDIYLTTFLTMIGTSSVLGAPFHLLYYWQWKRDLEGSFLYAFAMAVNSIVLDVYNASNTSSTKSTQENTTNTNESNNNDGDYAINFDYTFKPSNMNKAEDSSSSNNNESDTISSSSPPINNEQNQHPNNHDSNPTKNDEELLEYPTLESMLDSKLRDLYESAMQHNSQYHKDQTLSITLKCQPYKAKIQSLFTIPFLTREEVKEHPVLIHSYRPLWEHLDGKSIFGNKGSNPRNANNDNDDDGRDHDTTSSNSKIVSEIKEFIISRQKRQIKDNPNGKWQFTVIAQVAIHCMEVFNVKIVETGVVVQGNMDNIAQDVVHLVRFEMVVEVEPMKSKSSGEFQIGSWKIVDWDDLLDGNIWFR